MSLAKMFFLSGRSSLIALMLLRRELKLNYYTLNPVENSYCLPESLNYIKKMASV
jgi:hypothetical protein